MISSDEPEITVRKVSAYLPISIEMAMAADLITEDEARAQGWTPPPPPPRTPWRTRLLWRLADWRDRIGTARRALAGADLHENC